MAPPVPRLYPQAVARTLEIVDRVTFSAGRAALRISRGGRRRRPVDPQEDAGAAGLSSKLADTLPRRLAADRVVATCCAHELALIRPAALCAILSSRSTTSSASPGPRKISSARGGGRPRIPPSAIVLGITSRRAQARAWIILFERFVSAERNEPPDIDVDFEHERREEVIQYIYGKYGRDRAGHDGDGDLLSRPRSAIRDVGKAHGAVGRHRSPRCPPGRARCGDGRRRSGLDEERIREVGSGSLPIGPCGRRLALVLTARS